MEKFENPAEMLSTAIAIAAYAHEKILDKGGQPYIFHCLHVAEKFNKDEFFEKTAAVLHDVIEDTHINEDYLRKDGIPESILTILDLLTRKPKQSYLEYILNIYDFKGNDYLKEVAIKIKLNDLDHNTDLTRLPSDKNSKITIDRMKKYTATYLFLSNKMNKNEYIENMKDFK